MPLEGVVSRWLCRGRKVEGKGISQLRSWESMVQAEGAACGGLLPWERGVLPLVVRASLDRT